MFSVIKAVLNNFSYMSIEFVNKAVKFKFKVCSTNQLLTVYFHLKKQVFQ